MFIGINLISYFVFPIIIMTFDTYNIEIYFDVGFELKHILGKVMVHDWHLKCISEYEIHHLIMAEEIFAQNYMGCRVQSYTVEYYGLIIFGVFYLRFLSSLVTEGYYRFEFLCSSISAGNLHVELAPGFYISGVLIWYFIL